MRAQMKQVEKDSAEYQKILNIAINYGSRQEIVHAANTLIGQGIKTLTPELLEGALYTAHCPPLDLIVRTGAELRLSNFLLWQAAYAEFYFSDVLWPEYKEADVDAAVREFYHRKRRFGGV